MPFKIAFLFKLLKIKLSMIWTFCLSQKKSERNFSVESRKRLELPYVAKLVLGVNTLDKSMEKILFYLIFKKNFNWEKQKKKEIFFFDHSKRRDILYLGAFFPYFSTKNQVITIIIGMGRVINQNKTFSVVSKAKEQT